jgi:hypothetical protein
MSRKEFENESQKRILNRNLKDSARFVRETVLLERSKKKSTRKLVEWTRGIFREKRKSNQRLELPEDTEP